MQDSDRETSSRENWMLETLGQSFDGPRILPASNFHLLRNNAKDATKLIFM